jgi:UPF0176 protein
MSNGKQQHKSIVLFYKYFLPPLQLPTREDIEDLHSFLEETCNEAGLKGRILLATEGINGTLSAINQTCLEEYCKKIESCQPLLKEVDWKFSENKSRKEVCF